MAYGESYEFSKKGDMASGSLANITENAGCGTLRSENAGLHEAEALSIAAPKNSAGGKTVFRWGANFCYPAYFPHSAYSSFSAVAWSGTFLDKCILCTCANVLL